VDVGRGVVTESPNFPDWKEVPLQGDLERSLGESIALGNDANCAGLGEWVVASRRSVRHFALLTLGTGVGGCLIVDGRLVLGKSGLAGELGHLPIQPDGPICGCGGRGCLEQYASHSGILRLAARHFPPHALPEDAKSLVQLAMTGDARALATWAEVGQKLGLAVAMLVNALNLEEVALGGGISPCFPFVKDALLEEVERRCFRRAFADLRVYQAQLGNQAGLVGAGLLPFAAENPSA
jgi:glucokinase